MSQGARHRSSSGALAFWLAASATLVVPQAAAPVAFALVALALTGDASGGAAMVLAMTIAQVVGAVPIIRFCKGLPVTRCFRALVALRAVALCGVVLCAHQQASFYWLVVLAGAAGVVNGATYGYLRSLLNHYVDPDRLPRAIGMAATVNEVTYVLGPIGASMLGGVSPLLGMLVLTMLGVLPALLIPNGGGIVQETNLPEAGTSLLNRQVCLWLICAAAGGATVAAIEIGAVSLAIGFGRAPTMAILFTVPLCLASVVGGVWISMRNRRPSHKEVVALLCVMTFGVGLAALGYSLVLTIAGAILVGAALAPLATFYALILETLAPPHRRPEVFALLRTANALGVIIASGIIAAVSVSVALVTVTLMMAIAALLVAARG